MMRVLVFSFISLIISLNTNSQNLVEKKSVFDIIPAARLHYNRAIQTPHHHHQVLYHLHRSQKQLQRKYWTAKLRTRIQEKEAEHFRTLKNILMKRMQKTAENAKNGTIKCISRGNN